MSPPAPIAFYISGHGFGHASRDIEIINALRTLAPDLPIIVCTEIAAWLFERSLTTPVDPFGKPSGDGEHRRTVELREVECDTGLQQLDSLRADEAASVRRAAEFHDDLAGKAAREAALLRKRHVGLVVGDIPPLAFAAAAEAGIKAVAIGNFTWDWIYEGFPEPLAKYPELLPTIRNAYAGASLALRLPMHGGFADLDRIIRDIPLVARRSRRTRAEVRRTLHLPDGPLVLLSFGGYGVQGLDSEALTRLSRYTLVITDDASGRDLWRDEESGSTRTSSSNVIQIAEVQLRQAGYRYEDLVHAVDVVVTKPGYGIVSECIANGTAILYTSRGRFPEYDVLVAGMQRFARSEFIAQDALLAGCWEPHLDRLLASPPSPERPRVDGAEVAAEIILQMPGRQ